MGDGLKRAKLAAQSTRRKGVVHYVGPNSRVRTGVPVCGAYPFTISMLSDIATTDPMAATCKRCIASLRAPGLLVDEVRRG